MISRIIKASQSRFVDGQWVIDPPPPAPPMEPRVIGPSVPDPDEQPEIPAGPTPEEIRAEAEAEAARILEDAQLQAQALLDEAQARAQELLVQVSEAGYADGLKQGREDAFHEGVQEWEKRIFPLQQAVDTARYDLALQLTRIEPDLVRLSILIAAKILGREPRDAHLVAGQVDAIIRRLAGELGLRIELNPEDLLAFREPEAMMVETVGNPSLAPGEVKVDLKVGRIDATWLTQLDSAARALTGEGLDAHPVTREAARVITESHEAARQSARGQAAARIVPPAAPAAKPAVPPPAPAPAPETFAPRWMPTSIDDVTADGFDLASDDDDPEALSAQDAAQLAEEEP
jgi:flagellar biosynthesis/type III secretory pathway protein FliH